MDGRVGKSGMDLNILFVTARKGTGKREK